MRLNGRKEKEKVRKREVQRIGLPLRLKRDFLYFVSRGGLELFFLALHTTPAMFETLVVARYHTCTVYTTVRFAHICETSSNNFYYMTASTRLVYFPPS
jgi:hypothetical protein